MDTTYFVRMIEEDTRQDMLMKSPELAPLMGRLNGHKLDKHLEQLAHARWVKGCLIRAVEGQDHLDSAIYIFTRRAWELETWKAEFIEENAENILGDMTFYDENQATAYFQAERSRIWNELGRTQFISWLSDALKDNPTRAYDIANSAIDTMDAVARHLEETKSEMTPEKYLETTPSFSMVLLTYHLNVARKLEEAEPERAEELRQSMAEAIERAPKETGSNFRKWSTEEKKRLRNPEYEGFKPIHNWLLTETIDGHWNLEIRDMTTAQKEKLMQLLQGTITPEPGIPYELVDF